MAKTKKTKMVPRELFERALKLAGKNICPHEDTHRGGVLWEICDSCGKKWADDEGGRVAGGDDNLVELNKLLEY
jgi:hypothetical protein